MEKWYVVDDGEIYNVLSEQDMIEYNIEQDQIVKVTTNMDMAFNLADKLNREAEEKSNNFSPMKGYYNESKLNEGLNDCFYGCPNIKIRWHGEWSDPEVMVDNYLANYYDIENQVAAWAEEDGINTEDKQAFAQYCQQHENDIEQLIVERGEQEEDPFEMYENNNKNNKNMKNTVKLSEEQLRNIVAESVKRTLKEYMEPQEEQMNEEDMDEGWFQDKWNQAKTAANTFTQKSDNNMGLKDRFQKAKANWNTQGELNSLNNLKQMLMQLIDDKEIDPNITIAQLVGGAYNKGKFGKMTGMIANRQGQIANRGGMAN